MILIVISIVATVCAIVATIQRSYLSNVEQQSAVDEIVEERKNA